MHHFMIMYWKSLLVYSNVVFCNLMPRPSAWTKYFLSRTILKLSRTKILSMVKNSSFYFQKSFKMNSFNWKQIFKALPIRKFHFNWLLKAKNGLFNPGQNFCPRQFQNCPGQKTFCPGRWMRHKSIKQAKNLILGGHSRLKRPEKPS